MHTCFAGSVSFGARSRQPGGGKDSGVSYSGGKGSFRVAESEPSHGVASPRRDVGPRTAKGVFGVGGVARADLSNHEGRLVLLEDFH